MSHKQIEQFNFTFTLIKFTSQNVTTNKHFYYLLFTQISAVTFQVWNVYDTTNTNCQQRKVTSNTPTTKHHTYRTGFTMSRALGRGRALGGVLGRVTPPTSRWVWGRIKIETQFCILGNIFCMLPCNSNEEVGVHWKAVLTTLTPLK